jgi:catechol 2,3-dioxygenase-like lactoylglutathione lyase family enzyme
VRWASVRECHPRFCRYDLLGWNPPLLDVRLLKPGANDVAKRRSRFTVHPIDRLRSQDSGAGVARGADPGGEERRLGAAAPRDLKRPGRAEPAERVGDVHRASADEAAAVERAEAHPTHARGEGREPAIQRRSETEHRGDDRAVIGRSFLVNLLDPQGCLVRRRLFDAATELHQPTPQAIASLVEYVREFDTRMCRDCEDASTRGEPALDVRERRIRFEAEHTVEKERLRVRADRERRRITQVKHRKVERARHVGRCSRKEVEHGGQLDPLEIVHAASLSPGRRGELRRGRSGQVCCVSRCGLLIHPAQVVTASPGPACGNVTRAARAEASIYSAGVDEFAVPIMPANDLDATLSFYERLGFKNAGSAPTEWNYLIMRRGSVQLHFYGDPQVDPLTTSSSCYVYTEDADALYDEWDAVGVATDPKTGSRLQGPPVDTDYGMREFALVDPSGNLIRVGSPPFV